MSPKLPTAEFELIGENDVFKANFPDLARIDEELRSLEATAERLRDLYMREEMRCRATLDIGPKALLVFAYKALAEERAAHAIRDRLPETN